MDASLVTGWFERLARSLGGFPDPEAVQQAWAATKGLLSDQGGLGEQAEQALAPPATARLVRALQACAQQLVALDSRLGGAAAFRHAGGHSAQDLRAAGEAASSAAFVVSKYYCDLLIETSVMRTITAGVRQFLLGFGRAALTVPTGLDGADARTYPCAFVQLSAMACWVAAAASRQQPSVLAALFSPDVVPSHDLILWLTTMTEALRTGQPDSEMDELATYLSLLSQVLRSPGSEQHVYTAALAASPRAQAATVNLLVDRGLPTLLSGLQMDLQRVAQREPQPLSGALCVLLVSFLQHPALRTGLERRLHSPSGATVVRLAAQLARLLSDQQPRGGGHDKYVEMHSKAVSLYLLCCSIMGAQPPGHTAPRAEQLAAARELLQALPHLSLSLHNLSHADVEAGQLVLSCRHLLAGLELLGAVRTASSSSAAGGSQLGIASQTDAEDWLAACEAALRLVQLAIQLKERCCGEAQDALSEAAQHAAHICDELATALWVEVWLQGTLLLRNAAGSSQTGSEQSALLKRVWHVHLCSCRLLHGALRQLHDAGLITLLEGLDRLATAHAVLSPTESDPTESDWPSVQALSLAQWHAVGAAQAELQRRGSRTDHGVLQCIVATAAGVACAVVPGLLAIEPQLQAGLVSALDACDQELRQQMLSNMFLDACDSSSLAVACASSSLLSSYIADCADDKEVSELLRSFCNTLMEAGGGGPDVQPLSSAEHAKSVLAAELAHLADPSQESLQRLVEAAAQLAQAVQQQWAEPAQQARHRLGLAQVAAVRCCAYLRCPNVQQQGGPAAGEGEGSKKCSACHAVWYCSTACSHADWRQGGHRRVCRALGEVRRQARERRQAAAAEQQQQA